MNDFSNVEAIRQFLEGQEKDSPQSDELLASTGIVKSNHATKYINDED